MSKPPRMTLQTQLVLRSLLEDLTKPRYGTELCEMTGLPSGTVYPIVARMEQAGILESSWEDAETHIREGRPRRRYYCIKPDGVEQVRDWLAASYKAGRTSATIFGARPGFAGDAK
jgi:PadR family transcriptional regulator PadR